MPDARHNYRTEGFQMEQETEGERVELELRLTRRAGETEVVMSRTSKGRTVVLTYPLNDDERRAVARLLN